RIRTLRLLFRPPRALKDSRAKAKDLLLQKPSFLSGTVCTQLDWIVLRSADKLFKSWNHVFIQVKTLKQRLNPPFSFTMNAVPVEIIRHIFKMSLPSREEAIDKGRISLLDTPWVLTLVSPLWRDIALGTPSLWSFITIVIQPFTRSWIRFPIRGLELQISRSGVHPLQVVFFSEIPGYTTADQLFRTLVESCDRWETLDLRCTQRLESGSLDRMRGRLPLLREMHVRVGGLGAGRVGGVTNIFEIAPQLGIARLVDPDRQIRERDHFHFQPNLHQMDAQPQRAVVTLPWTQITIFESTYDNVLQFDGMRLAQNLVECQVSVTIRDTDAWQVPAQPTCFLNMKKLTLFLYGPAAFLQSLLLPALEELLIQIDADDFHHVVACLQRSTCSLRKFWINSHPPPEHLLQVLMDNPHILEIGIVGQKGLETQNLNDIVTALTLREPDNPQPVYALELTRFLIRDHSSVLNLDAVLDMVDSRRRLFHLHGCSRLEKFSILGVNIRVYAKDFKARLATLRATGLQIELTREDQEDFGLPPSPRLRTYI
ncbi:hypothetical protein DFH07DRAFT_442044, partial [Mycena maculata]